MRWIGVGWAVLSLASLSFAQWQKTLKEICHALSLPSFSPVNSVPLKNPSDFSPVALGWTLKSPDGKFAFAISDKEGKTLYEFGLDTPFWHESSFKQIKERILSRFGSFLSDGQWHFLYRGLSCYGVAVQKGMTVRMEVKTFEPLSDGREDGVWRPPLKAFSSPLPSSPRRFVAPFSSFLLLPSLRSTHAASCAMWAIGVGVVNEREPYQKVIGDFSGLITRCLCDLPERPFVHEIERGLPLFLKLRGKKGKVKTFLLSQTSWATLKGELEKNKFALVTFLYRKDQREKKRALLRVEGTTVLVVGFLETHDGVFLLSLPPLSVTEKPKKVKGFSEGLSLFRLNGPSVNIVFAFPSLEGD